MNTEKQLYYKKYYLEHREKLLAKSREYYKNITPLQVAKRKKQLKDWRKLNPEKVTRQQERTRVKLKIETLKHYSNGEIKCAQCGISDIDVLCIDHIYNGGKKQLKKLGISGGDVFYKWLRKNNFPEGFQVLCWNCNHKKEVERLRNAKHNKE